MTDQGRSATGRVAERRSRLIHAGRLLFAEYGYAGTSVRAVLREAGLSDSDFTEYFADVDALLGAVHDHVLDEVVAAGRAAVGAADDSSDAARAMINGMARLFESDPGGARIVLLEVICGGPIAARHRQDGLRRLAQLVADVLPNSPDRTDEHRMHLGIGLIAVGDTLLRNWLSGEPGLSRERVVNLTMTTFDAATAV